MCPLYYFRIKVIEDDSSDDMGTLRNVTNALESSDDNVYDAMNSNKNELESLVVAAPLSKDKDGTILVQPTDITQPANSAPPIEHEIIEPKGFTKDKKRNSLTSVSLMKKGVKKSGKEDEKPFKRPKPVKTPPTKRKSNSLQLPADQEDDSPSSPIVIKLSNTDEVNVVEQYFSGKL